MSVRWNIDLDPIGTFCGVYASPLPIKSGSSDPPACQLDTTLCVNQFKVEKLFPLQLRLHRSSRCSLLIIYNTSVPAISYSNNLHLAITLSSYTNTPSITMATCVLIPNHIGKWIDQMPAVLDCWTHEQLSMLRSRLWDNHQDSLITPKLVPVIQEFQHIIENDPELFMHFHKMFDQVRIPKDGWNHVRI